MGSGLIGIMQQGLGGTTGIAVLTTFPERRTSSWSRRGTWGGWCR
jgi:hypothetical protein